MDAALGSEQSFYLLQPNDASPREETTLFKAWLLREARGTTENNENAAG